MYSLKTSLTDKADSEIVSLREKLHATNKELKDLKAASASLQDQITNLKADLEIEKRAVAVLTERLLAIRLGELK